jgi:hypothetical protein
MTDNEPITWDNSVILSWFDFKAEHHVAKFEDAFSVIKYGFTWTVDSEKIGKEVIFSIKNIKIFPQFFPTLSSVRISEKNERLLNHEQGCFDLAELVKRKYIADIEKIFQGKSYPTRGKNEEQDKQYAREDSGKLLNIEIEKLENLFLKEKSEYQKLTEFGNNIEKQNQYNFEFKKLRISNL